MLREGLRAFGAMQVSEASLISGAGGPSLLLRPAQDCGSHRPDVLREGITVSA